MAADFDHEEVPDYSVRQRLDGRVYAVVGAGRGIGRQSAHALRQAGADVICIDSDLERAHAVAAEIGGRAFQLDATKAGDVAAVFDEIAEACGGLDGAVDIVGASVGRPLLEVDEDLVRQSFELNL